MKTDIALVLRQIACLCPFSILLEFSRAHVLFCVFLLIIKQDRPLYFIIDLFHSPRLIRALLELLLHTFCGLLFLADIRCAPSPRHLNSLGNF